MAEDFNVAEFVVPGVFVAVRPEGLISIGGIATGNIGIVGTAAKGFADPGVTHILGDYAAAKEVFGDYDAAAADGFKLNLTRGLEIAFRNGARSVFARALPVGANDAQPGTDAYTAAFTELLKDDVNILIAPQLATDDAKTVLTPLLETAENDGRDLLAVIGSDKSAVADVNGQVAANDRVILCAPGIMAFDSAGKKDVALSGTYTAAAVAGLLATLVPQSSPTNKVLAGVGSLAARYSYSQTKTLITGGVLVLEERSGVRVVRGITTEMKDNGPFKQITTRRIVDFAKAGIRQGSRPFIGRLNNQRVRAALAAAINGFLTGMVQDEALTDYELEVTATRAEEIAGIARVNAMLRPTFSIDFIAVTLTLQ